MWEPDLVKHAPDLLDTSYDGQFLRQGWTDKVAEWPGALERVGVEELHGIESEIDGVGRETFLILEIQEILAQLLLSGQPTAGLRRGRIVEYEPPIRAVAYPQACADVGESLCTSYR